MPDNSGQGGISPDAAYQAIQGQLTQISGQQSAMGAEIGQIRSDVVETKVHTKNNARSIGELKDSVDEIGDTLHGNGGIGVVTRMATAETRIEEIQRAYPTTIDTNRSTMSLPAMSNGWRMLKWQTIRDIGNKGYKVAIVVLLLVLGYKELARTFLGVPPTPATATTSSATEIPEAPSP